MFSFKIFLLFWVKAARERAAKKESSSRKGKYFGKKKIISLVGFGFNQMWKINNAKAAGSAVTSILKKLSQLSGKVMTAIMRQLL